MHEICRASFATTVATGLTTRSEHILTRVKMHYTKAMDQRLSTIGRELMQMTGLKDKAARTK